MPIRFRCPHCQQLLGIARRKAGTSVNCPTCHQSALVPFDNGEEEVSGEVASPIGRKTTHDSGQGPAQPSLLFERDDFDDLLNAPKPGGGANRPPGMPAPPPGYPPPPPIAPEDQFLAEAVPPNPGIFLSPARTTVLTVVVIVLVAAAFGVGVIVGRAL